MTAPEAYNLRAVLERISAGLWNVANNCSSSMLAAEMRERAEEFDLARVELDALIAERNRLNDIVNSPQSDDFLRAVSTEAEHQRQRWGHDHDGGKAPSDWFWLLGYLAGKALHAHAVEDFAKAEHHIITTAAACANWHRAMFGRTDMRPGSAGEGGFVREQGSAS